MKKILSLLLIIALFIPNVIAAEPMREWSLTDIYPNEAAFKTELDSLHLDILPRMRACEGQLRNPAKLLQTLSLLAKSNDCFRRLSVYVNLQLAADQLGTLPRENRNSLRREMEDFTSGTEKLRGELYALEPEYLQGLLSDARFAEVTPFLLSAISAGGHITETPLTGYSHLRDLPADTASLLLGADFHPTNITRPDGTAVPATYTEWMRSRSSEDEGYRRSAYEGYHSEVRNHRNTLAAQLDSHIRTAVRESQEQKQESALARACLTRFQMPVKTVSTLLENVRGALPQHRKFGALAVKESGKTQLQPWDTSSTKSQQTYSYDEACSHILASLRPLGNDYVDKAEKMLTGTHIDIYPREGKQSGAFAVSAGHTDKQTPIDPYILINFNGSYDDMSTLTHELGHAMHMMYSQENNPPALRDAPISLAEVASTAHELLLIEHMQKTAVNKDDKRFFFKRYAELIGGTLFSQTQLFSFEVALYTVVESGGAVTADLADTVWKKCQDDYRDSSIAVSDASASYWAAIPHFYKDFYVLNYATSITAAYSFAEQIADGNKDGFLTLLKSGNSLNAHSLLCDAGVDLTDNAPYKKILNRYEQIYTAIEQTAA